MVVLECCVLRLVLFIEIGGVHLVISFTILLMARDAIKLIFGYKNRSRVKHGI